MIRHKRSKIVYIDSNAHPLHPIKDGFCISKKKMVISKEALSPQCPNRELVYIFRPHICMSTCFDKTVLGNTQKFTRRCSASAVKRNVICTLSDFRKLILPHQTPKVDSWQPNPIWWLVLTVPYLVRRPNLRFLGYYCYLSNESRHLKSQCHHPLDPE